MDNNYTVFNRRLKRKSQVTLSIIAGFLILIIIVAIFYIREYVIREKIATEQLASEEFEEDTNSIKSYVEKCVRDTGYNGLVLLGKQGGYIEIPELINYDNNSYWYLDQINIQPTLDEIRERLSYYVNENVPECTNFDFFMEKGFEIKAKNVDSLVEFGTENVFINVTYPITIKRGDFEREIYYFYEEYNIRFRRIYEMASQINYRHFNPYFDVYHPLQLVYSLDFDVNNIPYVEGRIVYSIVDRTRFEYGANNYTLRFAGKFGNSELPRRTLLWGNSAYMPNTNFFIIYSLDRMARLFVMPDVMVNLNGRSVDEITTRQYYPENATAFDIVASEEYDAGISSLRRENRTWKLTYPVYSFEPTGTRFSQPLPMFFYWDNETRPNKGEIGILYTDGKGWHPIDSNPDYDENYAWTTAYGFSNYTVVDCGVQEEQTHSAKSTVKPKWPCFILLVINIVLIVATVGAILAAQSLFAGLAVAAMGAAVGMGINMAVNFVMNSIFPPPKAKVDTVKIPPVFLYPKEGAALAEGQKTFLNEAKGTTLIGSWSTLKEKAAGLVKIAGLEGVVKGVGEALEPVTKPISSGITSIKNIITITPKAPIIHPTAQVDPTATLASNVKIEAGAKVEARKGLPEKLGTTWQNIGNMVAFSAFTWVLGRFSFDSKIKCVEFTPTCDQYVEITKKDNGGKGKCTLASGWYEGGHTYQVCAVVKKCDKLKKFVCKKCSTTCTVKFI